MKQLARILAAAALITAAPLASAGDAEAGKAKSLTCAACHGVDGNSMTPTFPNLAGQSEEYIVKQLKDFKAGTRTDPTMNAMAAPLSDEDMENLAAYFSSSAPKAGTGTAEPAVVAQGKKLFQGGNAATGVSACMACHGPTGQGIPVRFPRLAGQHPAYVQKQLTAYRDAQRSSETDIMTSIASKMSLAEIKAVSEYIVGLQ